jgi:hypothetical protein
MMDTDDDRESNTGVSSRSQPIQFKEKKPTSETKRKKIDVFVDFVV